MTYNKSKLETLRLLTNLPETRDLTLPESIKHFRAAKTTLKDMQRNHIQLREQHFEALAEACVLAKTRGAPLATARLEKERKKKIKRIL